MKATEWIDLEQAASRLSGTTEEITCMVREGILGSLRDREGELLVNADEIERLVEVFRPAYPAPRGTQFKGLTTRDHVPHEKRGVAN